MFGRFCFSKVRHGERWAHQDVLSASLLCCSLLSRCHMCLKSCGFGGGPLCVPTLLSVPGVIQWSLYRWKSVCVWLVVDIFCVIALRYTWTIVELLLDSDGGSNVASVGEHDILVPSANCGEPCRVRLSIRKQAYVCCGGLFNPGAFLCWFEEEEGDGGKGFLHISSHSLLYLILTFFSSVGQPRVDLAAVREVSGHHRVQFPILSDLAGVCLLLDVRLSKWSTFLRSRSSPEVCGFRLCLGLVFRV